MTTRSDRIFAGGVGALALLVPLTLLGITTLLAIDAWPSITRYGISFLITTTWDPVKLVFGAGAYVFGTLVTTAIAVLLAAPIAIGAAVFIVEYAPRAIRGPLAFLIEVLAYIPSIVYGLWGFFVVVPIMRSTVEPALQASLGQLPVVGALFAGRIVGLDLLTGGVILAIMILPIILAVSREVVKAVPSAQREGMLALGATRWETVSRAILPYARTGIVGAAVLG
ncbi:MAG: phosphate ABC transporter permease subunit PstC, partial [Candidatus Limnocylindria bacterium]|nr:phosphate ABC transporter permease subunit PstC [Candidatus Limnocylindria bacterium]